MLQWNSYLSQNQHYLNLHFHLVRYKRLSVIGLSCSHGTFKTNIIKTALRFWLDRTTDATMQHSKPTILKPHSIFDYIWSASVFIFYCHFHYWPEFGAPSKLNVVKLLLTTAQVGDSLANCPSPLARGIILLLLLLLSVGTFWELLVCIISLGVTLVI